MEDKRRLRRITFKEPVWFRTKDHLEPEGCVAYNLSEGGIRLWSSRFLPLQEEVTLMLTVDAETQIDLTGGVVWVQKVPHSEYYQIGLEFVPQSADTKSQQQLKQYIQAR